MSTSLVREGFRSLLINKVNQGKGAKVMNLFHRQERQVKMGGSGSITTEQLKRLLEASLRPDQTGVNQANFEGFLGNPHGYGQTVLLGRAKDILGKDYVADHASVSKVWRCVALDSGSVPYSEGLLETSAQLNKVGHTFRLVYLFGLPLDRQLIQSRDQESGPRFAKAAQRWITDRYHPLLPIKLPAGYWLINFSDNSFLQISSAKIISDLEETFPRENWATAETVSEAVISLACAHSKEELRLLTEQHFHVDRPRFLSQGWLVGGYRPAIGLRVIPQEEAAKLSGRKMVVVTLIAM